MGSFRRNDIMYREEDVHIVPIQPQSYVFDEMTIRDIRSLCEVLRRVQNRMLEEGYTIVDGKIKKLDVIKF